MFALELEPITALVAPPNWTMKLSDGSLTKSSTRSILIVFWVCPGAKVTFEVTGMKSDIAFALLDCLAE